ncbi:MAG: serine hydrolase domain-containing protein [Wenzhouxiangellaceae bacterium]|nr:serine hydrolase domain-containing protein [Wenzhouxiangellaceae bacterium]
MNAIVRMTAAVLGLAVAAATHAAPAGRELVDAFDARFRTELGEAGVPGAAYAIVHRGQLLGLGTYGSTEQAGTRAVDSSTVFRIASVSKGFSGVLAAMLAAEGRFELDQPVAAFSPTFTLKPTQPRKLTVEDVLGQRSGFVRNAYDNLIEAGLPREEILPRFRSLEPLCAPGACYSYQNNIFSLIEDVVAETARHPWAQVMQERIFTPLGIVGASIGYQPFVANDNRAEPHLKTRSGWRHVRPRTTYYQVPSAAGINAGIVDMAQWAIAMLGHRPDVIPPDVIAEVTRPRIRTRNEMANRHWRDIITNAHYGLGWRVYEIGRHELALHGGWVAGYRAEIALSHELDLGIVILANAETRAVSALDRFFWDLAFESPALARTAPASPTAAAGTPE